MNNILVFLKSYVKRYWCATFVNLILSASLLRIPHERLSTTMNIHVGRTLEQVTCEPIEGECTALALQVTVKVLCIAKF